MVPFFEISRKISPWNSWSPKPSVKEATQNHSNIIMTHSFHKNKTSKNKNHWQVPCVISFLHHHFGPGKLYGLPCNTEHLLIFDPSSITDPVTFVDTRKIATGEGKWRSLVAMGGKLIGIPDRAVPRFIDFQHPEKITRFFFFNQSRGEFLKISWGDFIQEFHLGESLQS